MTWKDVTLRQYARIQTLIPFEWDDFDAHAKILAVLHGGTADDYLNLDRHQFATQIAATKFLYQPLPKVGTSMTFKAGGVRYDCNPLISTINTAEFIDLSTWTKDEKAINANLHNIVAIFARPRKRWFRKAETDRNKIASHLANNMNALDALNIAAFFLWLYERLSLNTLTFMTRELKKMSRRQEAAIRELNAIGLGSSFSTTSPAETGQSGITSLI